MPFMEGDFIQTGHFGIWVALCRKRFFAQSSNIVYTASSLNPSSWAIWLMGSRRAHW
jgi:hypothetical protein